jgi:hypothetical protein
MTVKISDHALVRWIERAHDVNIEAFREMLAEIAEPYAALRVKHVEIGGLWFVFDGAVLVTVLPEKPTYKSTAMNDQQLRNHSCAPREKLNWKAQARKRRHK